MRRDSEAISVMFDKNGALDPTRDSAPGLDKNIIESSLPPPEITIATFQNRARTAISRMDTLLVELGATKDPDQPEQKLSAFEVDLSMLLGFVQKLKKSPEVTGVEAVDPFVNYGSKQPQNNPAESSLFRHPVISSDEESDDEKTPLSVTTAETTTTTTVSSVAVKQVKPTGTITKIYEEDDKHDADDEGGSDEENDEEEDVDYD